MNQIPSSLFLRDARRPITILLVILVLLIAYVSPWVLAEGASLSLNAYDLAEWSSLHPAARSAQPALLPSLLLRLPLVCTTIALACVAAGSPRTWRTLGLLGALVAVIALLPPLEFLRVGTGDANYQQLLALAGLSLIGAATVYFGAGFLVTHHIILALTMLCLGSGLWGWYQGFRLIEGFGIAVYPGPGPILLAAASIILIIFSISKTKRPYNPA